MSIIKFINYKDKKLLCADFAKLEPQEAIENIKELEKILADRPKKSAVILIDATGLQLNPKLITTIEEFNNCYKEQIKAVAIVGITGLKKSIFNSFLGSLDITIELFDTLAQAKNWLARV